MTNKNKVWTDPVFGNNGEFAWCLLSLYPLVPVAFIWICVFLYDAIQSNTVMTVMMLSLGLLFVGFHGARITYSFLRLTNVLQKIALNHSDQLEGHFYFNRKFSFNLNDVVGVETLEGGNFESSIGMYAEIICTVRLKDGKQLSVLNTMEDYDDLLQILREEALQSRTE